MARLALFALILSSLLLLAGCAIPGTQQPSKAICANGTEVSDLSKCFLPITLPTANQTNATPEPQPSPVPTPSPAPAPQPAAECGNGICASNETFGTCEADCAPTYRYLYEYDEGLTFAYLRCDRIGDRVTCWQELTYSERAEPVYKPNSIETVYSVYNSYMLRIINGSAGEEHPIKMWVNKTSSECLRLMQPVPSVNVFYNVSPGDKFYTCPKIISVEYLGTEDVEVPIGLFPKAQKFRVTYTPDETAIEPLRETMVVWKAKAPLASYIDYKFLVHGDVLVPIKVERQWSYIDSLGHQVFVRSNSTLTKYIEPLQPGAGTSTGQSVG
ncbi:MAG: hypothetical protein WC759_01025 [Candidatus Micrarchaeia archaeon]|jgi:hypothetical protein